MRMKLATGLLALLGAAAMAATATAATTVKVGVILTYSGPQATLGDQIDKGLKLYMQEHQHELPPGVKIDLIRRDDTGPAPEVAKRLAQELLTRDHVQILTGMAWTPNTAAILPLSAQAKVPVVIMNATTAKLTRMSPYVIRTSCTLWQTSVPIGNWAAKQGWKTAATAVSDFAPGHDAEAAFTKGFTDAGGKVVSSVRFPVINSDFVPFLQRIKDTKPDVLYIFVPSGPEATAVMKAYNDLGMAAAGIHLVGPQDLVPDYEIPNMGNAPLGLVTSGYYSRDATRPANKAFVAAWTKAYGAKSIPDFMAVGGWDGMAAIFDLVKATKGKFTGEQAAQFLSHWKNPHSPRGPIAIDPATRDIVQDIYIRRIEKKNGRLADVEFATIKDVKDPWKELNPEK